MSQHTHTFPARPGFPGLVMWLGVLLAVLLLVGFVLTLILRG